MSEAPAARLHALDNLRAIMMWLGIVLHAGAIYLAVESTPLPWRDTARSPVADLLVVLIHAFRMPAFFILAGFFAALLADGRGPGGMLKNRALRIALPFALFWPFVWVATGLTGLLFMNLMATGRWGLLDERLLPPGVPRGATTMHMWFLWQLLWLSVAASFAMRLPRAWFQGPAALLHRLGRSAWGFAALTLPLVLAGWPYPHGLLMVGGSFLPPWSEWLHHGLFFVFGLVLHRHRHELFALYQRRRWGYMAAGLATFLASGVLRDTQAPAWAVSFAYNSTAWLWSFGLVGLALRTMSQRHRVLGYLSESAYWVYLLHLPLTVLFGAVLYDVPLHALAKMLLNIGATTAVCLASYELLVRHTWVSVLLNGKRHPRRGGLPPAAAPAG